LAHRFCGGGKKGVSDDRSSEERPRRSERTDGEKYVVYPGFGAGYLFYDGKFHRRDTKGRDFINERVTHWIPESGLAPKGV